jgi:hypothetical protein
MRPRRRAAVVDTNVPIAANGREGILLSCANNCAQALLRITKLGMLVIDDGDRVLSEYRRHLSLAGQPGVGDMFVKWAHDHAWRANRVARVRLTPIVDDPDRFREFPSTMLPGFDRSDEVFVAVARTHHDRPPILNATDSDWWTQREALARAGVEIMFLCPELFLRHVTPSNPGRRPRSRAAPRDSLGTAAAAAGRRSSR